MSAKDFSAFFIALSHRIFELVNSPDNFVKQVTWRQVAGAATPDAIARPSNNEPHTPHHSTPCWILALQGGILAMDDLIDVPVKENEYKIIRFANFLRGVFVLVRVCVLC